MSTVLDDVRFTEEGQERLWRLMTISFDAPEAEYDAAFEASRIASVRLLLTDGQEVPGAMEAAPAVSGTSWVTITPPVGEHHICETRLAASDGVVLIIARSLTGVELYVPAGTSYLFPISLD